MAQDEEAGRIAKILEGMKKAYQHPATQKVRNAAWTATKAAGRGASAGAGLMGGLAASATTRQAVEKGQGAVFILLGFFLMVLDTVVDYKGFIITDIGSFFGSLLSFILSMGYAISAGVLFYFFTSRERDAKTLVSWILAIIVVLVSFAIALGFDIYPLIHLTYIIFFWLAYIRGKEYESTANLLLAALIICDLYLFSIISSFSSSITFLGEFPFLFFLTVALVYKESRSSFSLISMVMIVLWYVFTSTPVFGQIQGALGSYNVDFTQAVPAAYKQIGEGQSKFVKGFSNWISGRIRYAITGKVEQNQYEPLGVYLENVKASSQRYYENEPVYIWGTVKTRTLDEPVNVKVGCYLKEGFSNKLSAKKVDPPNKFSVFTLEEQDFACTFDNLNSGTKSIVAYADFNFETLSFLKIYFMDRDRLRAMTRENVDIFQEFKLKDKSPIAIYTNGPIEIGIKTASPIVGVGNDYIAFPRIRVSLQSRQGWEGRLKDVKELILLMPKGAEITSPETDCNEKFEPYDRNACETKSCQNIVNECKDVCKVLTNSEEKAKCENSCNEELSECQQECSNLFFEETEEYNGYSINIESLKAKHRIVNPEDIEKFTFFDCGFNAKPNEILGNSPITTKTFRVKARYDYTVEKPLTVSVSGFPGVESKGLGDVAITGSTEMEKRIIRASNELNIDPVVALSVAKVESGFKHCNDGTLNCGTSNKENVYCNTLGSCGVMQINRGPSANAQLFESGSKYSCFTSETAYDLDCNLRSGIGILKENFNNYGNDEAKYNEAVDTYCIYSNNPEQNGKYKSYKDPWERALRAYNGFGCTSGADTNYVEKVRSVMIKYRSLNLQQVYASAEKSIS